MMKMKLGQYFMNKDYYFQKVRFDNDTKLMVSNRLYNSEVQFQWTNTNENIRRAYSHRMNIMKRVGQ